ncbi:response regulator transcription factor [Synechococcus sp. BSF8S]|uniref:response regulator transcription factor n=1 Tax=Synechococcales TaxID=1890424 RepID=UPI001628F213|nr:MULTISPECIES: response regulator transcription factor [unclassified Synechococcus]MBC1262482.1 response regulator transcription factor [Synechococcus sp. BSF8S]MBC1265365.1 response regulator transcription factor [Synechococcus sp. BSA11S]
MDLTHILESIPSLLEEYGRLLEGKTIVACLGNSRWLGAFICINPITRHVVGACTTEEEGYRHVLQHRPHFLLVSETLHEGTGVSLVRRAERFHPDTRTILITNRESTAVIGEALKAGCDVICFETEDFTPVFRIVAGGGVYYPKEAADVLKEQRRRDEVAPLVEKLTEREVEVLTRVMLGLSNRKIGERLYVSAETVKTHVGNVINKLQARDRTHAAVLGMAMGIISLEAALNTGPAFSLWGDASA